MQDGRALVASVHNTPTYKYGEVMLQIAVEILIPESTMQPLQQQEKFPAEFIHLFLLL